MEKPYQQDKIVAVDVETTGLSAGLDEIIEIGAVLISNGKLDKTYHSLICPKKMIPREITKLTGITWEMVKKACPIEHVLPEFLKFAGNFPLLGHNLPFDYSFLKAACMQQKISFERKGIDTLRLARILLPSLEKKTLSFVADFYEIDIEKSHRASYDAISCAKIYLKMLEKFGNLPGKQELFFPQELKTKIKKSESATAKQKKYLLDLLKYHKIEEVSLERLTKSEASMLIDYFKSGQLEKATAILAAFP